MVHHASSKNSSDDSSSFPLPTQLLVHVLSHLQLPQRLGSAALVCKAWREAANAATTSISHTFNWNMPDASQRQLSSIPTWLERGTAQHITAIDLDSGWGEDEYDMGLVLLPLQKLCKLRSLRFVGIELEQPLDYSSAACSSSNARLNPLAGICNSLTALDLSDVQLNSFSSTQELFRSMASLSKLQRLELDGVRVQRQQEAVETDSGSGRLTLADALCRMPQLTRLKLSQSYACELGYQNHPAAIGTALAGLQQLQDLQVHGFDAAETEPQALFRQLPAILTKLQVIGADVMFSPSQTPALMRLTALCDLHVVKLLGIDPAVLSGCASSLTRLFMWVRWGDSTLSALVRTLPQMLRLQNLELKEYSDNDNPAPNVPQLAADDCALLLSPAKLTSLGLQGISLAPGAAAWLFAAGRTSLRGFSVSPNVRQQSTPPLAISDLSSLVRAWPQLQQLQLAGAVAAAPTAAAAAAAAELEPAGFINGEDILPVDGGTSDAEELATVVAAPAVHAGWAALGQLTALTSLCTGGRVVTDHTLQELAALTSLKTLVLLQCPDVTAFGLLQLTQLTGLLFFRVSHFNEEGWDRQFVCNSDNGFTDEGLILRSQEPYPDVWEQLDAICRENVDCLQKLLAEQAQLVQRQAEQLKQQALQLQQLQGAQQQVMQLEQQLAAARASCTCQPH